jgi:hypothetical protein
LDRRRALSTRSPTRPSRNQTRRRCRAPSETEPFPPGADPLPPSKTAMTATQTRMAKIIAITMNIVSPPLAHDRMTLQPRRGMPTSTHLNRGERLEPCSYRAFPARLPQTSPSDHDPLAFEGSPLSGPGVSDSLRGERTRVARAMSLTRPRPVSGGSRRGSHLRLPPQPRTPPRAARLGRGFPLGRSTRPSTLASGGPRPRT